MLTSMMHFRLSLLKLKCLIQLVLFVALMMAYHCVGSAFIIFINMALKIKSTLQVSQLEMAR